MQKKGTQRLLIVAVIPPVKEYSNYGNKDNSNFNKRWRFTRDERCGESGGTGRNR